MDIKSAEELLNNTFEKKFDLNNFEEFIIELFNNPKINIQNQTKFVKKGFKNYVNDILSLGSYHDEYGENIGFYAVELNNEGSIDRARTMQRNLIAQIMKNQNKDAAIAAFYEPNSSDWRFSFVKLVYSINEKGNIKENLSSARRHSFLVGENEPNHTCSKQFRDLLTFENKITLSQIENAFKVENVTNEFFNTYKDLFINLKQSIEKIIENDKIVAEEFSSKNIQPLDFAKKLMGQIVFIYFIQKKGWLGVEKDKDWGTGSKKFLTYLYEKKFIDYDNFFNDVLEPLFYKGLSKKVPDYHYNEFNCKIPFLNGGLFEPINNYDWEGTELIIDNEIFENILKTFNRFNFTVREDEPLEKEVAVDPEMLGKVFEKLLDVKERADKGSFYTPREIVHYICQKSLISYLNTNTNISVEDLTEFIENGDLALESILKKQIISEKSQNVKFVKLPESIQINSELLNKLLKEVKILDPAVGSGAFPVGMMNEIVKARHLLLLLNNEKSIDLFSLKKETIENSLYGVDLDYSATEIAKLRFWLSLIIDSNKVEALPNLDNKIMCGNSLNEKIYGIKIFDKEIMYQNNHQVTGQQSLYNKLSPALFEKLKILKSQFFNESRFSIKQNYKKEIETVKWNIIKQSLQESLPSSEMGKLNKIKELEFSESKSFFIWDLEFSEVFNNKNPGFDIIIGNPPYIKEYTNRNAFDNLRDSPYYQGKMDIWTFFGCVALDLVKQDGCVSFIAPNNWITSFGASKFREKVNNEAQIVLFKDFGNYKVFESASIQTMIYLMKKNNENMKYNLNYSLLKKDNLNNQELLRFLYSPKENKGCLKYVSSFNRKINKNSFFLFLDNDILKIINKIKNQKFIEYLSKNDINQGIVAPQEDLIKKNAIKLNMEDNIGTGIFVLNNNELNNLNLEKNEYELIKPFFTSEELFKYYSNNVNKKWIIYTKSTIKEIINDYPNIKNHLDKYSKINTSSNKPYGLHRARDEKIFLNEKIICIRKCKVPTFTYVPFDSYVPQTFNLINTDKFNLKYLVGILNSELIQFWLRYQGKMQGYNYQLDKEPLLKIPIINNKNEDIERNIIKNVDCIISKCENENLKTEKEVNQVINLYQKNINYLVYQLYEISEEEKNIIQQSL